MSSTEKRPDPPGDSLQPSNKKQKKSEAPDPVVKQQSSLLSFFGKKEPTGKKLALSDSTKTSNTPAPTSSFFNKKLTAKTTKTDSFKEKSLTSSESIARKEIQEKSDDAGSTQDPIVPEKVPFDTKARWRVKNGCLLVRTIPKEEPRTKVAAFDMDGTLLVWRIAGWPSRFEHYELWNPSVITKFRQLHDEGSKLVIFSNQGAVRSAVDGKKATTVKTLVEWLASIVQRPLHCVMSTDKKKGYHKPSPRMFRIAEQECNQGVAFDQLDLSSYVGDSVGKEDPQGGVDEKFAQAIGEERDTTLKFFSPDDYFGPSTAEARKKTGAMQGYSKPPAAALQQRSALLGGYLRGPLLLILAGVQGSGKSTFCSKLLAQDANSSDTKEGCDQWIHLSQDTIQKGKPGKRQLVEQQTRQALQAGKSVVVDRMHLNEEQRGHFVAIGKECNVQVHAVLLQPSKDVVAKRVRERTGHPGGVEGEKGARMAIASLDKVVVPHYDEGFHLISCTGTENGVTRLGGLYRRVMSRMGNEGPLPTSFVLSNGVTLPSLALGTMGVGKRKAKEVVPSACNLGWKAVDTAPTYKNEAEVAQGFQDDTFVIVKVPKRATNVAQVREELRGSLANLGGRRYANLLLLHWPCDVIEAGTLGTTWQEMEKCLSEGLCNAIGVSNFSIDALRQLIPNCKVTPSVNQVERHPLLPQIELLNFCANHDILIQAHTPLGQGKTDLLENDVVMNVAKEAGLGSAQVVMKWNLQHGVALVPKCTSDQHLKEAVSSIGGTLLTSIQMETLDGIKAQKRFVAPPFMYRPRAAYSWGDHMPKK